MYSLLFLGYFLVKTELYHFCGLYKYKMYLL